MYSVPESFLEIEVRNPQTHGALRSLQSRFQDWCHLYSRLWKENVHWLWGSLQGTVYLWYAPWAHPLSSADYLLLDKYTCFQASPFCRPPALLWFRSFPRYSWTRIHTSQHSPSPRQGFYQQILRWGHRGEERRFGEVLEYCCWSSSPTGDMTFFAHCHCLHVAISDWEQGALRLSAGPRLG